MTHGSLSVTGTDSLELKTEAPVFNSAGSISELILLIIVFILIILACYYVTKFIGNKQLKQMNNSNFTVIDTYRVTANKFLQLVKMGEKYVVIAVTKDNIRVVTELSEEEVIIHEPSEMKQGSFKDIFTELVNKKKNNRKG